MSIMVGTGHGAKNGVLVKEAAALEVLEKVDTIVVDKTGTLTEGKPRTQKVVAIGDVEENEVLRLAASLENLSEHPLASAIVNEAKIRNLKLSPVEGFKSITGSGVEGMVSGHKVIVGSNELRSDAAAGVSEMRNAGQTVVFVTIDDKPAGLIGIADQIKTSSATVVKELHRRGIRVIMMTGDNSQTAAAVADKLSIDQVFAGVKPQDKAAKIKELQSAGNTVAMAGDGVNDAPALAQADIGITFASGTNVAVEAAGITLLHPDMTGILKAINLSRATMKNIRLNLFFAFIYNVVGVPIAAGILFPFLGILLSPMIASVAMTFSSVSVILNSLRLRNSSLST